MMIVEEHGVDAVAGTVTLWTHEIDGASASEIGWMVLPERQGRGLAKQAVRSMLRRAGTDGRWGIVHAYPSVDNAASNGICRSLGFTFAGVAEIVFAGLPFRSNHWWTDPRAELDV